jgi:hypothetical protein
MLSAELGPDGGFLTEPEDETGGPVGRRVVMLYADPDTQANLTAWAHAMGFDVGGSNPHEGHAFHITLLATENDVAIPLTDHTIEPVSVEPTGFEVLGENGDTPVMRVVNLDETLFAIRTHYVLAYGAEPTFELRAHVSLSYDWAGEPTLEELPLPDFPLVFDRLVVEAFDGGKAGDGPDRLAALIAALERA